MAESKHEESRFRALHWVFRVGNLQKTMQFYENVLGMHVLRHEEFSEGCEATCNGPYGGAWSKTMIGYESESTGSCLEITYNYGIESYARGNDLRHMVVHCKPAEVVAVAKAEGFMSKEEDGQSFVQDPSGVWYKLVDAGTTERRLAIASVLVSDLSKSTEFYKTAFEMSPQEVAGATPSGVVVGHSAEHLCMELNQSTSPIEFKESKGRLATETAEDAEIDTKAAAVTAAGGKVIHGPMVLPPHSEAVVIVEDLDGYEFCFVGKAGYAKGSLSVTNTVIDWGLRRSKGGDGAPVPKAEFKEAENNLVEVEDDEAYEKAVEAAGDAKIVVDCMATWCKKCASLYPTVAGLSTKFSDTRFVKVDIDELPDFTEDNEVFKVPCIIMIEGGKEVSRYEGSDPEAVTKAVEAFLA